MCIELLGGFLASGSISLLCSSLEINVLLLVLFCPCTEQGKDLEEFFQSTAGRLIQPSCSYILSARMWQFIYFF